MFVRGQNSGGGSGNVSKVLDISSVSASSIHSSGSYNANRATDFSYTTVGWLPTSGSTSADITINFGSSKTVDYIVFGMVSSSMSTAISAGDMMLDIYADGTKISSDTFSRTGTGYVIYTYPINKQASSIKVALTSAAGASTLTSGSGYKILAFGS